MAETQTQLIADLRRDHFVEPSSEGHQSLRLVEQRRRFAIDISLILSARRVAITSKQRHLRIDGVVDSEAVCIDAPWIRVASCKLSRAIAEIGAVADREKVEEWSHRSGQQHPRGVRRHQSDCGKRLP